MTAVLDAPRLRRPALPTTPPATPKSPGVIRETLIKLGDQRGNARYYAQGKYLKQAGFLPGVFMRLTQTEHGLEIIATEETTANRVSVKKGEIPVIDLTPKVLADLFGIGADLHVRVSHGRILLRRSEIAERAAKRPTDGSVGSLFSGGGLLDQAAVTAGFTSRFAVEIDDGYADLFQQNHPSATMYRMSVHEAAFFPLPSVELLVMGIPCEAWSHARRVDRGTQAKRDNTLPPTAHELGDMALWAFACILQINPRTVIIEEVAAFAESETGYALRHALDRLGYAVSYEILNAADYGGFTERKRAVIVAQTPDASGKVPRPFPNPTPNARPIASILEDNGDWFDRTTKAWLFNHAEKQAAKGNGFGFSVVDPNTSRMPIIKKRYHAGQGDNPILKHPSLPDTYRWFTVKETARLMGLPDDYYLGEAKTTAGEIIGQGVDVTLFARLIRAATNRHPSFGLTPPKKVA